jgi:hypothetical protein
MTRHFLRTICRALVGAVLFAQLAVSAYACPGRSATATMQAQMSAAASSGVESIGAAMAGSVQPPMSCEDMAGPMDPDFANLCAEHCHHGQQSNQSATLTAPAALLNALYIAPLAPEPLFAPRPAAAVANALVAASPPLAILHCCFRI